MIKVSDYIAQRLKNVYNVEHVFLISGGGAMHLNDSLGKYLNYTCNHHEQASAIAAEGYARVNQKLAVVNVTTGPGGLNALNGVFGQWTDSVPVLYISGQVKYQTTVDSCHIPGLRQLGDQEVDIVNIVKPLVKYAEMVKDPLDIKAILDKAVKVATSGRFGPVWIDVPMDIQGAYINENELREYETSGEDDIFSDKIEPQIDSLLGLIKSAKSPLIVAGHGIRLSQSQEIFLDLVDKIKIPVVTTFNGVDILPEDNPVYIGRIGTLGQRAGNFALQNADLVICLGTRNNIRQISYNWENYASKAKIVAIDIDNAELLKPTLKLELAVHADINIFIPALLAKIERNSLPDFAEWLNWCLYRKEKYHPTKEQLYLTNKEFINPYLFTIRLTEAMRNNSILVAGNGSACVCAFQAGIVKTGQRFMWNSGDASMGYDLPAALGASIADTGRDVVCLAGDGSLMMNIQELQTIKHYNLPVKLFILNNDGYVSIQQTQRNFFPDNLVACTQNTGVSFPDFIKLAQAFELPTFRITSAENLSEQISTVLECKGPAVCEVYLDRNYSFVPKASALRLPDGKLISKSLDDMFPFLSPEEISDNVYNG